MMNKLFRYFSLNLAEERTIRQISLEARIPYMTLSRLVKELEKQALVVLKKHGQALVCSLNKANPLTKQHLILASEAFKNKFLEKKPLLREINFKIKEKAAPNFSAVLFGSYASGKEQKHSDVDLAFISDNKKLAQKIQSELRSLEQIHEIEINTMIFTERQFQEMLKSKEENVGKQILKNHVVLNNPELFWNLVYGVKNGF